MNNKEIEMPPIEETPVVEQAVEETPVIEQPSEEVSVSQQASHGNQENIRQLRESRERAERERDELLAKLRKMEEAQRQPVVEENEQQDFELAADDFVEGKHLKSYAKKVKDLEKQLNSYKQQTDTTVVETRLKTQYKDFDTVVSQQNIEALRLAYPEIASTINSNNDLYSKAVSAYTLIKKLGIHKEDTFAGDREKVKQNAYKPRPLTSVSPQEGEGPLSKANAFAGGLTEELKRQLYKEMMESRG